MYTLKGKLKVKNDTQQVSDSFKKREFVITDDSSNYAQHITFQLVQDRVDQIEPYNLGDELTISFYIRGREWTDREGKVKYFNSLDVWKIEAEHGDPAGIDAPPPEDLSSDLGSDDFEDDLPF